MAEDDDYEEDYYEPDTSGDDDYWEPPEEEEPEPEEFAPPPEPPEDEPPPEDEGEWERAPPGGFQTAAQAVEDEDIENAPPYQVAGPPMPPPKQTGTVDQDEGTDGEWERAPPGGFAPGESMTPPMRFVRQGEQAVTKEGDDEWERAPPGGFKPEDNFLWKSGEGFLGNLERGVSGVAQTGELLFNKLLGRETETGTEERPLSTDKITAMEALKGVIPFSGESFLDKTVPFLAAGAGRSAPLVAGAIAGAPVTAAAGAGTLLGVAAGGGLGQFLSDVGPKYRDDVAAGKSEGEALKNALMSAGISGAAGGGSLAAFGLPGSMLTHLLMQPTLIQPTISATEKAVQNYLAGEPITKDLPEAAAAGAVGGLIPAGGHKAATTLARGAEGLRTPPHTAEGPPGRYTLGTRDPELPLKGGYAERQGELPLRPPSTDDQFRMPQPELPLRTPGGEQGQLPLPGGAGPTPENRVGRALPEVPPPPGASRAPGIGPDLPQERRPVGRPGTERGVLETPPAPNLPGPGGRTAERQTEVPLFPPRGREPTPPPAPPEPLLPPRPGEQVQFPFPGEARPTEAGRQGWALPEVVERDHVTGEPIINPVTGQPTVLRPSVERHGSPGSQGAAGTAEAQPPPRGPAPGEPGWLTQARGPEDWGKDRPPRGPGGGMNVNPDGVDPTVRGTIKNEPIPQHLDQRTVGELIQLARQGGHSEFMRQSLANELERRGIRNIPEPAGAEPATVGQQLREREAANRRATEESQNLPGAQKPGGTPVGLLPPPRPGPTRPVAQPPQRGPIALPDRSLPQRPRTATETTAPRGGERFWPGEAPRREPPTTPRPEPPRAPTPRPPRTTVPHVTPSGKSIPLKIVSQHTLRDILGQHTSNKGLIGQLTDFIRGKVADRAGEIPVYVVADKDFYGRGVYAGRPGIKGYYAPAMDHIVIPERVVTGAEKHLAPQVILHEGLHGATYRAVDGSPQLQTALKGVMRDVLREHAPTGPTRYGFTNVHEFITEGFTNPHFQDVLRDHVLSPKAAADFRRQMGSPVRNAWDAMVQTVRKIIGAPEQATTALEALMRATGKAIETKPGGKLRNTPLRVEAERPGGMFTRAEKMTTDEIRAALGRADTTRTQRAVYNDVLRSRGESTRAEAPAGGGAGGRTPPPAAPPGGQRAAGAGGSPKEPPARIATKEDLQRNPWATAQRWLGVRASSTESGRAARNIYMGAEGRAERARQVAAAKFTNEMHRLINTMPPGEQRMLVNWIQGGDHFPNYRPDPKILPIVDQLRSIYKDFEGYITSMSKHEQQQFWDNSTYLTGQFKNKEGAHNFYSTYTEGGPRAGGSGSLKSKKFPTDEDARAAGHEPASTNPIQRVLWYVDAMSRYLSKTQQLEEGKASGYIKYYGPKTVGGAGTPEPHVRNAPPPGWTKLDGVKDEGGRQAFAPTEYAQTFNNAYSPGLAHIVPEDIVTGVRRAINTYTAVELGGPAYHFLNTMHEGLASHWATALSQFMAGKPIEGARSTVKGVASPLAGLPAMRGWNPLGKQADRITDVFLKRAENVTPQEKAIVDAMERSNWKPLGISHTLDYEMARTGSLWTTAVQKAWKTEFRNELERITDASWGMKPLRAIDAALTATGRVAQTIAHPLFQYYIPRMKIVAAYDNVRAWLDEHPHATPDELRDQTVKILKSIDNRMGEMAHDNMLMHRGARDLMALMMRSPSFSIGGVVREITAGGLSLGRGALKGENRASLKSPNYDPRTAYFMSFFLATGAITAVYQYLKTGSMPDEKDLGNILLGVAKTGGKIPGVGGKRQVDEQAIMPGYNKDFRGYYHDFWGELKNKLPGLHQAIIEQIRNEHWGGATPGPIVPPKATMGEELAARLKAFGERSIPIMGKQGMQTPYKGSNISYPEQLMGVRAPGTWQRDPDAYQKAADKREQDAWDRYIRRENIDRANRGLPPLPKVRPSQGAPAR